MHPARSLVLFTSLSGLGFGLLAFLGLGIPDVSGWVAFVFFAIAFGLAGAGLLFSTTHLGHPERALKAFTQWRSSWLSREGWCSVAALSVMGLYAIGVIFLNTQWTLLGWLGALLSIATVFTTSMIYTQLKTVPRWNHWTTPVLFLIYAIVGGGLLAGQTAFAASGLLILGAFQIWAWMDGDARFASRATNMESATGLGAIGSVRSFEPPHTGGNYLTTEMVHVVARKHAAKLRVISFVLMVALPWFILVALPFWHALASVAMISHIAGVFVSRWLFFAQAEHVVGLYYGKR